MKDYPDIRKALTPRRQIKASEELHSSISNAIGEVNAKQRNRLLRTWLWGMASAAAAAILIICIIPAKLSAKEILTQAATSLKAAGNIEMTVDIRTRQMENFHFIDINEDYVKHHISVSGNNWRIDKGGRIAMRIGTDTYTWIPSLSIGWHIGDDSNKTIGFLATLLAPEKIIESELNQSLSDHKAKYTIRKDSEGIELLVHTLPEGDFSNPYLLKTSIASAESIRRYSFDAKSKHLTSASVSIISDGNEIEVLRISNIKYGANPMSLCKLPTDIHFIDYNDGTPQGLRGLSASEAASAILGAFENWNNAVLDKAIDRNYSDRAFLSEFKGAKLLSIGQPFKSGNEENTFVPYCLQMPDSSLKQHNLSLRQNDAGGWVLCGGL